MFEPWQIEHLTRQWGRNDDLNQYVIAHLQDRETGWDWYFMNLSPDLTMGWAIIDGLDLEIGPVDIEILQGINNMFLDGIKLNIEYLPLRASHVWQNLKNRIKIA